MKTALSATLSLILARPALGAINWDVFEHGVVDSFKWSRPFPDDGSDPGGFHVNCRVEREFHAKIYKLTDLPEKPPTGLAPWQEAIEYFLAQRAFVGSWDGVDHKGKDREIVVMEYSAVPGYVRHWIEAQQQDISVTNDNKWLYGVFEKPKEEGDKILATVKPQPASPVADHTAVAEGVPVIEDKDKIVVFPAGAIYEILPLWVAEGSRCEREFNNLDKYRPQAVDHSILAWPVDHTKPQRDLGKRDITFKIEAMAVTETEDGKRARLMWERLHRTVRRNERRLQKEERLKAKKEIEDGHIKDEL
ncbi:hypothetical protein B0T26DRAFT_744645 [Lasiosphaeria miniovina]|uniref:Uncharacterized protein n=1 Tax=Lasiosphaeria miniovina TaxID=1954250 RepID=A0AA40DHT5_9PEZI|nr:uncharacterized protein B0T26DRAFT_744645 [Lasiosphaeria miniovina]KAK0704074.1 hypothetical protein B0T26DRAFT_744645 [Lasiosphaeria miniovina]